MPLLGPSVLNVARPILNVAHLRVLASFHRDRSSPEPPSPEPRLQFHILHYVSYPPLPRHHLPSKEAICLLGSVTNKT